MMFGISSLVWGIAIVSAFMFVLILILLGLARDAGRADEHAEAVFTPVIENGQPPTVQVSNRDHPFGGAA